MSRGATLHPKVVVTGVGTYGERVEREPITGVWGQKPPAGSTGRIPGGGPGGKALNPTHWDGNFSLFQ